IKAFSNILTHENTHTKKKMDLMGLPKAMAADAARVGLNLRTPEGFSGYFTIAAQTKAMQTIIQSLYPNPMDERARRDCEQGIKEALTRYKEEAASLFDPDGGPRGYGR